MAAAASPIEHVGRQIYALCVSAGTAGAPQDALRQRLGALPGFDQAMRALIQAQRLEVFDRHGSYFCRVAAAGLGGAAGVKAKKLSQLNELESRVYEAIKAEDTKGLWLRSLKQQLKSFGTDAAITKATKKLEKDQLIKQVKSVANRTRTLYMLFELDPHESVTGGTWFNEEQQFDEPFVKAVRRAVHQIVCEGDQVSIEMIERSLAAKEVAKKSLSLDDVQAVANILVYDGALSEVLSESGAKYYRVAKPLVDNIFTVFTEIPCASCPVQSQCDPGGSTPYNPQNCPYLTSWLHPDREDPEGVDD